MAIEDESVGGAHNLFALACGLCLAAIAGGLGCGARSPLQESDAPPSRPTDTPDAGMICTEPTPIELPESLSFHVRRPALTRLAHSTDVSVVYGLDALETASITKVPLGDVVFDPWGAWPPDVKGPFRLSDTGGVSFAVDVGATQGFVLFGGFLQSTDNCSMTVGYGEDLDPTAPGLLEPLGPSLSGGNSCPGSTKSALFMATNLHAFPGDQSAFLMGYDGVWGGTHHRLDLRDKGGAQSEEIPSCTQGSMVADAVAWEKGFLVAASGDMTGLDIPLCYESQESPTTLLSLRLHTPTPPPAQAGPSLSLGAFDDPIARVQLSARGDGAWLLSQTFKTTDGATSPIHAQRIVVKGGSEDGQIEAPSAPFDVVPAGRKGFAAAPLGDGLALAWLEPDAAIGVAFFDDAGTEIATATVPAAPGAIIDGPVSVLAAPVASAVLVAWSETPPQQAARVKVVRFDCLDTKKL
jgi:hypothetical protein